MNVNMFLITAHLLSIVLRLDGSAHQHVKSSTCLVDRSHTFGCLRMSAEFVFSLKVIFKLVT